MLHEEGRGRCGRHTEAHGEKSGSRARATNKLILKRLMWPLTATLLLLVAVIAVLLWRHQEESLQASVAQRIAEIPDRLKVAEVQQLAVMGALLERITADKALQTALQNRDRERLLADNSGLYEDLRRKYGISHFYFQDSERNNILRVQFPGKIGGRIDRYTTLQAEQTGKIAGGVELGSYGLLSLRVVQPVFSEGRRIGFVELGKGIDVLLSGLRQS